MNPDTKEIIYNLINCGLAGTLVFLGGFSTGNITTETLIFAGIAAGITFFTQFKNYWEKEINELNPPKILTFI